MSKFPAMRSVIIEVAKAMHGHTIESILKEANDRLGDRKDQEFQQAILATWGSDLLNPNSPRFHFTERGKETLKHLSRDPSNPDGYMEYLSDLQLDPIADSYIRESLLTYNSMCYKAAAVMLGGASERLVLELRDVAVARLVSLGKSPGSKLKDWRIKTVFDELSDMVAKAIDQDIRAAPSDELRKLRDDFSYHWPSIFHGIRASRNDAGHPGSIDPVTPEDVHGALLTFPHLARVVKQIKAWIPRAPL